MPQHLFPPCHTILSLYFPAVEERAAKLTGFSLLEFDGMGFEWIRSSWKIGETKGNSLSIPFAYCKPVRQQISSFLYLASQQVMNGFFWSISQKRLSQSTLWLILRGPSRWLYCTSYTLVLMCHQERWFFRAAVFPLLL